MVRVDRKRVVVKNGDAVFNEILTFADPSFFEIFDFRLALGNTQSLSNPSNIIISRNMAEKYYADTDNPLGSTLQIIVNGKSHLFTVAGVADKFPNTASFQFNFLVSLENYISLYNQNTDSWTDLNKNSVFTYLLLDESESITEIRNSIKQYIEPINESNPDWPIQRFDFEPFPQLLRSHNTQGNAWLVAVHLKFWSFLL